MTPTWVALLFTFLPLIASVVVCFRCLRDDDTSGRSHSEYLRCDQPYDQGQGDR